MQRRVHTSLCTVEFVDFMHFQSKECKDQRLLTQGVQGPKARTLGVHGLKITNSGSAGTQDY